MRIFIFPFVFAFACTDKNVGIINSIPEAKITENEETLRLEGYPTTFYATFSDTNHQGQQLNNNWFLNGESVCPQSEVTDTKESSCTLTLDAGDYTISVQVIDQAGASHQTEQVFSVTPTLPPTFEIEDPNTTQQLYSDQLITFSGFASDPEDPSSDLIVDWRSDNQEDFSLENTPDNSGYVIGSGYLHQGAHLLTATVTDKTGKTYTANTTIEVGPPNTIPECAITLPENHDVGAYSTLLNLHGLASDADISSDQLIVEWHSDKDGLLGTSTPSSASEVLFSLNNLSINTHTITMKVQDEVGATCSDFISYTVTTPPMVDILTPSSAEVINEDDIVLFSGLVHDSEDAASLLDISWSLDGAADVHTIAADNNGNTEFARNDLEPGEHIINLRVTDSAGYSTEKEVFFSINDLPSSPTTNISPLAPKTSDDLTAQSTGSTDSEGDVITYSYEWLQNGVPTGITSTNISASLTSKGEIWTVISTPSDSYGSGIPTQESTLIENTAPEVTAVTIAPNTTIYTNSTIHCAATALDVDETPIIGYEWVVDGVTIGTSSTTTLDHTKVQPGQNVRCIATAQDSDLATASLETVVTIDNLPPHVQHTTIVGEPKLGSSLDCESQAVDPDGGTVSTTYEWIHPTLGVVSTDAHLPIDTADYAVGDSLTCMSTTSDDMGATASDNTSITIQNSEPDIDSVSITPNSEVQNGSQLTCHATATDINNDAISISYSWTHNGQNVSTGAQYTTQNVVREDSIECVTTATDIHGASSTSTSEVLISNHIPSLASATLSPQSPRSTDTLVCATQGAFDQDGDAVIPSYTWKVDGVTQIETTNTLSGPFPVGSTVTCEAVSFDGFAYGNMVQAQEIVINTAPEITALSLLPNVARTNDSLTATVTATDIDNQNLSHHFDWYVNSQLVQSSNIPTLHGTTLFNRGDSVYVIATTSDNSLNSLPVTSSIITIENTAPVLSSVAISDLSDTKQGSVMTCNAIATDEDQDSLSYNYNWFQNGSMVSSGSSFTISSAVHGDEVKCEAIATDGFSHSDSVESTFTVDNTAPIVTSLSLSPAEPKADEEITCVPQASDVDGETVNFVYTWDIDGAVQSTTIDTLPASAAYGSVVTCHVTPTDGTTNGIIQSQSITIANTAPVMTSVSIEQSNIYTQDTIFATALAYDLDNHTITFDYDWFVNGQLVQSGSNDSLDGTLYFDRDDEVTVRATPNDGLNNGAALESIPVTVLNTVPEMSEIALTQDPTPNQDDIICSILSSFDLDGDQLDHTFIWYKEGIEYTGPITTTTYAGDTVPSNELNSYETWSCEVITTDSSQENSTSLIQNTLSSCSAGSGLEPTCPGVSCYEINAEGLSMGDGTYWIDPTNTGSPFPAHCDMTTDGGGWTMCYSTDNEIHMETETTPDGIYGETGYRTDCRDIPFSDIIVEENDTGDTAWFTANNGDDFTLEELGYRATKSDFGTLFTGHGLATTSSYDYQVMVCDGDWMPTGFMVTGYVGNCEKSCSSWCQDNSSMFFRANGDNRGIYAGVAFNENGHRNVSYKMISFGIR